MFVQILTHFLTSLFSPAGVSRPPSAEPSALFSRSEWQRLAAEMID